jgi:hypothetical protein
MAEKRDFRGIFLPGYCRDEKAKIGKNKQKEAM